MKDIPLFDTETGVSSLVLKEIPYRQIAYITVRDVQDGGLQAHLEECVSFCRMCGAERVFASGHPELEQWPLRCTVQTMALTLTDRTAAGERISVTEQTVSWWREIYQQRMAQVDNAATLTQRDEKQILSSGGACFVCDHGTLLGIGWLQGGELLCVASVVPGAGDRILKTLLSAAEEDRVTLDVASTNVRAIRLYERMGFRTVGERSRWYQIR